MSMHKRKRIKLRPLKGSEKRESKLVFLKMWESSLFLSLRTAMVEVP